MNQDQPSDSHETQPDIQIPEESGSTNSQLPATHDTNAVAVPEERRTAFPVGIVSAMELGRRPTNILSAFGGYLAEQLEDRQTRADRLQDALTDEKVAHARTDERLAAGLIQSGTKLFSATVGGTLLGIGLGAIDFGGIWARLLLSVVGIGMIGFGCLPYIRSRWKS